MLITSNDLKERIIADLKQDLLSKQASLLDYKHLSDEKQRELDFLKLAIGSDNALLIKRKYREYRNEVQNYGKQQPRKVLPIKNFEFKSSLDKLFPPSSKYSF